MVIVDTEGRFPDAESIKGLLYDLLDLTLGSVLGAGGVIASNVLPSWLGLVGGLSLLAAGVRIAWQPSSRLMKNISLTDN